MTMRLATQIIILLTILLAGNASAWAQTTTGLPADSLLSIPNGQFPRLLTDHRGQPLLTWVERTDTSLTLTYQRIGENQKPMGSPVQIALPPATAAHGEDVPKLIVKGDGTMMVVFNLPKPTAESIRAGELLYRLSADGGRTWTPDRPVHRDTQAGKSHSYADLTRLPNGEIGIVWLDDKLPGREGRSVRFTQTLPGDGFGPEMIVDSNACQCCRTGITTDSRGRIYLIYRDWLAGNIRDVSYVVSSDNGQSFSKPQVAGNDGWAVNACPHAGPQLHVQNEARFATWYSGAAKREGVRVVRLDGGQSAIDFVPGAQVKHPQLTGLANGQLALVWESLVGEGDDAYRQLWLRTYAPTGGKQTVALTAPGQMCSHPVLLPTPNGLLVAYQIWEGTSTRIMMKHFLFSNHKQ